MKNTQDRIISKSNILIFAFVINVALLVTLSFFRFFWIYAILGLASALVMLPFVATNNFVSQKLSTLLIIFAFPIYSIVKYVFTKSKAKFLFRRKQWQTLCYNSNDFSDSDDGVLENLKKYNYSAYKISNYNANYFVAPVYQNTSSRYIATAKNYYDEVLKELVDAKKYIFIDAYKIMEGDVWDRLFEVLKQKAREGVEVKILYNPKTNKHSFVDKFTYKKLVNYKIEVLPFRSSLYGFASHRKFFVVDGVVAFVGGANIADNHLVVTSEYGNWHQSGIKLTGDAVWQLTMLFLNSWQFAKGKNDVDYLQYKPEKINKVRANEFVQPISMSPLANRNEVRDFYINLINNAQHDITITGSCLMIDSRVLYALSNAVKCGVVVNIIVSSQDDKFKSNVLSRGYYPSLIRNGINVYEYSAGALRSKLVVIDGITAVVGGANLDVRKLEAKFECSVLVHNKDLVKTIENELKNITKSCKLLTIKDARSNVVREKIRVGIYKFLTM